MKPRYELTDAVVKCRKRNARLQPFPSNQLAGGLPTNAAGEAAIGWSARYGIFGTPRLPQKAGKQPLNEACPKWTVDEDI